MYRTVLGLFSGDLFECRRRLCIVPGFLREGVFMRHQVFSLHMVWDDITGAVFHLAVDIHVPLPAVVRVMPVEQRKFLGFHNRIPILIVFGYDDLPGSFVIHNPVLGERISRV